MTVIEEIEDFQNILKKKLSKELNIQSPEQLDAFIRNFENSEDFKPFQFTEWHESFYVEFKQSFENIQQCDLNAEVSDITKALNSYTRD